MDFPRWAAQPAPRPRPASHLEQQPPRPSRPAAYSSTSSLFRVRSPAALPSPPRPPGGDEHRARRAPSACRARNGVALEDAAPTGTRITCPCRAPSSLPLLGVEAPGCVRDVAGAVAKPAERVAASAALEEVADAAVADGEPPAAPLADEADGALAAGAEDLERQVDEAAIRNEVKLLGGQAESRAGTRRRAQRAARARAALHPARGAAALVRRPLRATRPAPPSPPPPPVDDDDDLDVVRRSSAASTRW